LGQYERAFIWQGGVMTDLGALTGDLSSRAADINDRGQVVGRSANQLGQGRAFLWEGGVMTDLNTLLPPDSGWVLQYAFGINNNGQVTGLGDYQGEMRAYLLDLDASRTAAVPPFHGCASLFQTVTDDVNLSFAAFAGPGAETPVVVEIGP